MRFNCTMIIVAVMALLCGCNETGNVQLGQHPAKMARPVTMELDYLLYLPSDYGKVEKQWPLILFLHGIGERGHDVNRVKINGLPNFIDQGKEYPFIVVSPQCPGDSWWTNNNEKLIALIDDVCEKYDVDESRVYLTGLSMGGYGTWALACTYPERFAAIAPVCGGGLPVTAWSLKDVPVWAFHGAKDPLVPLSQSQDMVDEVNKIGGSAKLTVYPETGHDSWVQAYSEEELYKWFLEHKK